MSKFMVPPLYSDHGKEQQLKNLVFQAHDLMCGCQKPSKHLEYLFAPEKCHHSNVTTTFADGKDHTAGDAFDAGDLERIFSEEYAEDNQG